MKSRSDLYLCTGEGPPENTAAPYRVCHHIGFASADGWYVEDASGKTCDGPHGTEFEAGCMATHWNRWTEAKRAETDAAFSRYFGGGSDLDRLIEQANRDANR